MTWFTLPPETIKTEQNIGNNRIQDIDTRQTRTMIPERWETNEVRPQLPAAYCLEKISRPQRVGNPSGTQQYFPNSPLELLVQGSQGQQNSRSGFHDQREQHRETPLEMCRGSPLVFGWVPICECVWGNYPGSGKEPPERIRGKSDQFLELTKGQK